MSEVKRYDLVDISKNGEHWSEIRETKHGNFIHLTDYQAAQAKIKELENTIGHWQIKNDALQWDKVQARIEKLEQANKIMREALEFYGNEKSWISSAKNEFSDVKRTIVKNENDCESFGYQASPEDKNIVVTIAGRLARETLNQVKEILDGER